MEHNYNETLGDIIDLEFDYNETLKKENIKFNRF